MPQHEFTILNVCQEIKKLEDDQQAFQAVLDSVAAADGVLWAFPLYYNAGPRQLQAVHRTDICERAAGRSRTNTLRH